LPMFIMIVHFSNRNGDKLTKSFGYTFEAMMTKIKWAIAS
jgi:hypothetical protein